MTDYDDFFHIESDNSNNLIKMYRDFTDENSGVLVFTYGEHPKCFIDGCQVLDTK